MSGHRQRLLPVPELTDGEFVREHPDEGYDCDPSYLYTSDETFEN